MYTVAISRTLILPLLACFRWYISYDFLSLLYSSSYIFSIKGSSTVRSLGVVNFFFAAFILSFFSIIIPFAWPLIRSFVSNKFIDRKSSFFSSFIPFNSMDSLSAADYSIYHIGAIWWERKRFYCFLKLFFWLHVCNANFSTVIFEYSWKLEIFLLDSLGKNAVLKIIFLLKNSLNFWKNRWILVYF